MRNYNRNFNPGNVPVNIIKGIFEGFPKGIYDKIHERTSGETYWEMLGGTPRKFIGKLQKNFLQKNAGFRTMF